jgi:Xaa-Pro aminopeptidase
LRAGMVLNIATYAGTPGVGGMALSNNVFVTDGDPEIYTTYPFDERLLKDAHPLDKSTGRTRN